MLTQLCPIARGLIEMHLIVAATGSNIPSFFFLQDPESAFGRSENVHGITEGLLKKPKKPADLISSGKCLTLYSSLLELA